MPCVPLATASRRYRAPLRRVATVFAATIGVFAAAQAAGRDYPSREVAGWTVAASQDGKGCFLTRSFGGPGATTLLLGLEGGGGNHLTLLNADWSIAPKDRLELTFRLTNSSFPKRFAVGIAADGKQGFVTSFGARFPEHFAASRSLQVFRGDVPVARLDLAGSGAAVTELRKCVADRRTEPPIAARSGDASESIPRDPFALKPERPRKR